VGDRLPTRANDDIIETRTLRLLYCRPPKCTTVQRDGFACDGMPQTGTVCTAQGRDLPMAHIDKSAARTYCYETGAALSLV
jgi:hypothetical protein